MKGHTDMTNNYIPDPDYERFVRIIKGYKSEQEARDLVRRARNARMQKAKDTLIALMQHRNTI